MAVNGISPISGVERAQHSCLITVSGKVICPVLVWGPLVEYLVKLGCDRPLCIHLSLTQRLFTRAGDGLTASLWGGQASGACGPLNQVLMSPHYVSGLE